MTGRHLLAGAALGGCAVDASAQAVQIFDVLDQAAEVASLAVAASSNAPGTGPLPGGSQNALQPGIRHSF